MMRKYLTVAAGLIAASILTLAAAPAMAHRSDYDRYWDRDGYDAANRYEHRYGAPFSAWVTMAPPSGAIVGGMIRLEVRGSGLENVELLPASGYTPKLGRFHISPDRTFAWLDFDTTRLSEGVLHARISAFNVPAGYPGSEIIAMPPRRWNLR